MHEERLITLETKISYQEDTLHQLNDVICRQQQQIDKLEAITQMLRHRLNDISAEQNNAQADNEKPPHY